jgi:LemA protein
MFYVFGIALIILVVFVIIFNRLTRLKNLVIEAWSGIDVQLKKRYELIPQLTNTVKAYASFERSLFENITVLRGSTKEISDFKRLEEQEIALTKSLDSILILVESYPELKADKNFLELQQELARIEDHLQKARRYYNGAVRNYNVFVQQFPSSIVARLTKHSNEPFFDIDNEIERHAPEIDLKND